LKTGVILPSNQRRNVDRDLLLIQQARRINTDLQKLDDIIQTSLYQWKLLSDSDLRQLKRFEQAYRRDYIRKFDWLWHKQVTQIRIYTDNFRKKRKNKKDSKRYRNRKKLKKSNVISEAAEASILNKSNFLLDERHKQLLLRGLSFAPTPNWTENAEDGE